MCFNKEVLQPVILYFNFLSAKYEAMYYILEIDI